MSNLLIYSQEILYLVLAFCILWLTVFLVWFVYYLIMSVRQFYQVTKAVKEKVDEVDEIMQLLRRRLNKSSSYLSLIVDGVKKITEVFKDKDVVKVAKKKIKKVKQKVK